MPGGFQEIGRHGVNFVRTVGGMFMLLGKLIISFREVHRSLGLLMEQLYLLGVKSLPLIVIISIFVGAVSAWQAAYQFKFIGAPLRLLGHAVGKAVVIELAPVLSAIVYAGRVGAGVTAELGTMKVTEQIDALESMGISPVRYLVLPRVLASVFMVPFLVIFANFVAIVGALVVSIIGVAISSETFLTGFKYSFELSDFINGLIKAAVFGFIIGIVGCYYGFTTRGGAQGVGRATTSSVVVSMVLILIFNFVFAVILFRI
ncbi:MAG: ABC transporter permease [Candidatus Zixiibacteriota bacterium]|nr:MAG: ABC transporter permease [candidate division Zixibacteria bacterium]